MTWSNLDMRSLPNKLLESPMNTLNLIFLGVMIGGSILILGSLYLIYDAQIFGERQNTKTDLMWVSITFTIIHIVLTNASLFVFKKIRYAKTLIQREKDELAKIDKAKEEFMAMISHELKTPLVPISGYAGLLLANKYGKLNDMQREKICVIQTSTQSMLKLISDLLDTQKIELGKLRLDKKEEDLNKIILDTVEKTKLEANKAGISIITDLQAGLYCLCDKHRIGQVISNTLLNSFDFCPKKTGKIRITTRLRGDLVEMVVKDNGIGMTKEKLSKIFVKFYQGDTSITREHGGTGLGLAVCKGVVEGHDGKIWLESEGVGKGTEVHIILSEAKTTNETAPLYPEMRQNKDSELDIAAVTAFYDRKKTSGVICEK